MTTVQNLIDSYLELIASQESAPDWPYPGQSYAASDSAADARWQYWHDAQQWASEEDIAEARKFCSPP